MNRPLPTLLVLLVAVAAIAMLILRGNDPAVPMASTQSSGSEAQALAAESDATGLTVVTADAAAQPDHPDAPERIPRNTSGVTPVLLRIKVRRSADGSAVPQAFVRLLLTEFVGDAWTDERLALTNALGDAMFDVPPGRYLARCVYGGQVLANVQPAEARDVELLVPPGYAVEGRVEDTSRKPIPDAAIQLAFVGDMRRGVVVATTDADGRFKLQDLSGSHYLAARHDDHAPSPLLAVQDEPGRVRPVLIRLQDSHGSLHGTVTDAQGRGIARARIAVAEDPRGAELAAAGGRRKVPAPARTCEGDPDGTFHVEGLRPGRHVLQAMAPGHGVRTTEVEVLAGKSAAVVLQLEKCAQVAGMARDGKGQPLAGVLLWSGMRGSFGCRWTVTDGDGAYLLTQVTPGRVELTAWRSARESATTTIELAPGRTGSWDPQLAEVPVVGVLRGHLADSRDQPLSAWRVLVRDQERKDAAAWRETDPQGSFVFHDLRPGATVTVMVFRPGSSMSGFPDATATGVRVDAEDLDLRVADTANTWGLLRGRVTTPDGRATQARVECVHTTQNLRAVQETDAMGGFEIRAPAGSLDLRITQPPYPTLRLRHVELQSGAIRDLGGLALALPGRLTGSVVARGGGPPPALELSLLLPDGEDGGKIVYADGVFTAEGLAAGNYRLAIQGTGIAATMKPFQLGAGEHRDLRVELQPGTSRRVRVLRPAGSDCGSTVSLCLMDGNHERSWIATAPLAMTADGAAAEFEAWLAPGVYRALAVAGNGFQAAGRVDTGEAAAEPVVLRLSSAK